MIYALSDLHLERFIWKKKKELDGDSYAALYRVMDAIENDETDEERHIILAGDITDTSRVEGTTIRCLRAFMAWAEKLPKTTVYIIRGNHDKEICHAASELGAVPLHEKSVKMDGRVVYGLNWMNTQDLQEAVEKVPESTDVLVLHCRMAHLAGFHMGSDLSIEEVPEFIDHMIVGDIHIPDATPLGGARGYCVSPGGIHPCKIDETRSKGFFKLAEGDKEWEYVEIPSRPIYRFSIESVADTDEEVQAEKIAEIEEVLAKKHEKGLEPLVEIRYPTECRGVVQNLKPNGAYLFTKPSSTGKLLVGKELEEFQENVQNATLRALLPIAVDKKQKPELFEFLRRCIEDKQTAEAINDKLKEAGIVTD